MANKHMSLDALFADIADAIREKIGDEGIIPAVEFPNLIRDRLEVVPPAYLTFTSPNAFSIAIPDPKWNGTMEYSLDKSTWNTWNGTELSADAGKSIYLRGTKNTYITGNISGQYITMTGEDIRCEGNIETLLDYEKVQNGEHPTMAEFCYNYMFNGCDALTVAPDLPATTLADGCYDSMFDGCTNLIQAPALPATTLVFDCYSYIFKDCTSLTSTPELPATTLADHCYYRMFMGCTGLTSAPELPVTTLPGYCYDHMFWGCTGIKLSTTKTGIYGKEYRIPTEGTGTVGKDSLYGMFNGTGGTFTGTPSINTVYYVPYDPYLTFTSPNAFSIATTSKTWDGTLEYSLDKSTWSAWDGSTLSANAGGAVYLRGTGNTIITGNSSNYKWVLTGSDISCIGNIENLLDYATVQSGSHPTMADYCYYGMFQDCTSLTQVPVLPATTLANECYDGMFLNCTSLTQAPALPATTLASYCYQQMFRGCTGLTQAPALPATALETCCYASMFNSCTSLVSAPVLPATTLAGFCYSYMFKGCTSMTSAPKLPATALANYCYNSMFQGCTSLTQAPALPATKLAKNCYSNMFRDCKKIKVSSTRTGEYTVAYRIPKSGTGTTATNALNGMFTSTGGTFTGTPSINTTYYLSNTNEVIGGSSITVNITASNISEYFTVTNGSSYYFKGNGNVFTTNNAGVNSSTASTTLTAKQNISEISFNYSYSSEPSYDKFTLKVAGSTIENAVSGSTTTKSYNGSLTSGQTIEFKYAKDGSVNKNDDKCTFSNMVIKLG